GRRRLSDRGIFAGNPLKRTVWARLLNARSRAVVALNARSAARVRRVTRRRADRAGACPSGQAGDVRTTRPRPLRAARRMRSLDRTVPPAGARPAPMRAPAYPEAAMRVGCCRNLMLAGHFRLAREALASELMHAPERGLLLCPVLGHCDR